MATAAWGGVELELCIVCGWSCVFRGIGSVVWLPDVVLFVMRY